MRNRLFGQRLNLSLSSHKIHDTFVIARTNSPQLPTKTEDRNKCI